MAPVTQLTCYIFLPKAELSLIVPLFYDYPANLYLFM